MHRRKENKMQYEAIFELREVLRDLHIEYVFRPAFDGYQIVVIADNYAVSFVQHMGSYGSQNDLIEAWDHKSQPEGYLSVFGCLEYLKERHLLK